MLALRAHQKGLELLCHLPSSIPMTLIGDPGRVRQILINLVSNAIKFTERGEIVVEVQQANNSLQGKAHTAKDQQTQAAESLLEFTVRDTGLGIPTEKLQIIFDPFSQAESSTTPLYGGTGLGLAISKSLVELMGGPIWKESPNNFFPPSPASRPHISIIAMTASLMEEDRQKCIEAGVDDFLAKPIDQEKLKLIASSSLFSSAAFSAPSISGCTVPGRIASL